MTVTELIANLERANPNAIVRFFVDDFHEIKGGQQCAIEGRPYLVLLPVGPIDEPDGF